MIYFRCPTCHTALRHPTEVAFAKCPKCGLRFEVPAEAAVSTAADWQSQPPPIRPPAQPSSDTEEDDELPPVLRGRWTSGCLAVGVGGAILSIAVLFLAIGGRPGQAAGIPWLVMYGVFVAAVIMGLAVFVWWAWGQFSRCPVCGKGYARVVDGKELVEQKKCYGLVTRRSYTWGGSSYSGTSHRMGSGRWTDHSGSTNHSSTTSWKERVPVIRSTYELSCRCKHCGHEWQEQAIEQVEDFDRR